LLSLRRLSLWQLIVFFVIVKIFSTTYAFRYHDELFDKSQWADSNEYISVANSLLTGEGFISPENNINRSYLSHLGDNYEYCAEPGYPVFLTPFYLFTDSDSLVMILSNTILQIFLLIIFWMVLTKLGIRSDFKVVTSLLIVLHGGINFYSFTLLPEILRIVIMLIVFSYAFYWYKKEDLNIKHTLILGLLTAIAVLIRTPNIVLIVAVLFVISTRVFNRKILHITLYVCSVFVFLFPWMIRNYNAFDYFNIDPRFRRQVSIKEGVIDTYRITNNKFFRDTILHMDEEEKQALFEKSDRSVFGLVKAYGLRLKEFLRLYPSGGDFSSPIFKILSSLTNLPYLVGLFFLFFSGIFRRNRFWFGCKILVLSHIAFLLVAAGPHARYMLPLVPLGYLFLVVTINNRFNS
jgi:hypothetical protein